jgi:Putative zinc-finger
VNNKPKYERVTRPDYTCKEEVRLIANYLAERLDPTVLAAFEKHLGQCPDCTAFLNTYKKTIEVTKSFLRIQSLPIWTEPPGLRSRGPGLLAILLFWLHLFISNTYLTTG